MTDEQEYTNPYPPGSENWNRYNLGIKPGVIGYIEMVTNDDQGLIVKGQFFDSPV